MVWRVSLRARRSRAGAGRGQQGRTGIELCAGRVRSGGAWANNSDGNEARSGTSLGDSVGWRAAGLFCSTVNMRQLSILVAVILLCAPVLPTVEGRKSKSSKRARQKNGDSGISHGNPPPKARMHHSKHGDRIRRYAAFRLRLLSRAHFHPRPF